MKTTLAEALEKVVTSLNTVSRRPIYEKYDKNVQGNTVIERGQAVVAVTACFRDFPELDETHSATGVAIGTGGNPNFAKIDPQYAAEQAIIEGALKTAIAGGEWLGATDCLNFGNPEKNDQMGQFVAGVTGVKTACETLGIPIVSGNVSLYNESAGRSIPPSAIVSVFARVDQVTKVPALGMPTSGHLFFIGQMNEALGGSEFLRLHGQVDSRLPVLNYARINDQAKIIRKLVDQEVISMANIVSTGGLWKSVVESALTSGHTGFRLNLPADLSVPAALFGESLGILVATDDPEALLSVVGDLAIQIGRIQGEEVVIEQSGENVWSGNLQSLAPTWHDRLRSVV